MHDNAASTKRNRHIALCQARHPAKFTELCTGQALCYQRTKRIWQVYRSEIVTGWVGMEI